MADPLSIGVSVLAVLTATLKSAKSLSATVKRYKERDKTLSRLQQEVEDLINVFNSLQEVIDSDAPILLVLQGPVDRCGQVCREFEDAMEKFGGRSKPGLRDWTRMESARGDINGFMDTLANYKSTVLVGLGTITMSMIKDTSYNLEVRLQRIETFIATEGTTGLNTSIDLRDEKEVTKQCLRICQDAQSFIESLQKQQPSRRETGSTLADATRDQFEAELRTAQTLNKNRDNLVETVNFLQQRLVAVVSSDGPERSRLVAQLRDDIEISNQCLEVCKEASEQVRFRKIHTIGEVIADDDNDQVVITTLADLFDVRKVMAKNRTTQLVGSMSEESLQRLSGFRYSSRFGTMAGGTEQPSRADSEYYQGESTRRPNTTAEGRQAAASAEPGRRPSPNEVRKRAGEGQE
ncbi:hypothetical protein B0T25DRAFT_449802 [Lasiosphaeria hispida]|uniref:Azaphilone pigments biosynthesis cluster protein L N-terminal domain-containing protein n=1 Tax=Lasiosphaeria hispida TaxID=260671 RepID=A0AAJ0HNE4_9PEZI|nr:hypothetical protein B0T25DRAFT_449802 [Lasiosphaeria hispida]